MKRFIAKIFIVLIVLANIMPVVIFAEDGKTPPPSKPYEKVVAKSGNWYSEQLNYEGSSNLVVGYLGDYVKGNTAINMEFVLKEDTVLKGIYLPFQYASSQPLTVELKDKNGNIYKDLPTEKLVNNISEEKNFSGINEKTTYVYSSENIIILPKGTYTIALSSYDGAAGVFLVKGVNYQAYEKYVNDLQDWEIENNLQNSENIEKSISIGNEKPGEEIKNSDNKNGMAFLLDEEYLIDEVIINTYNDGLGAVPGVITIINESNEVVISQQAFGGSLEETPNGMWKIAPGKTLPVGTYIIEISDPTVISYDDAGEPLFYVKASIPVKIKYDFTGTYNINLDAYKTRTLMGPVSEKISSFSLKDFELTVLDKKGEIEIIGKYEGIPFSQSCEIVEDSENYIVAKFIFAADLSNLPYKAKIGADAVVTLTKNEGEKAKINLEGTGTFKREATAEKGADDNEYSVVSNGVMTQKELPVFVMTALGKSGGAGNIPGPDNSNQAATGMLFPPLVGVVVAAIQDLLKPKKVAKSKAKAAKSKTKAVVKDKNWYKEKNPNLSEEQLAMVMLADAMGGTDNPDEGDVVSVGDNEKPGGSDYVSTDDTETDMPYEDTEQEPEQETEQEPEHETEPEQETEQETEQKTDEKSDFEKEQIPEEPEEMVLQTSANGATSRFVKDPETGEWVNSETGSVLNYGKYKEKAQNQFAEDKKINDEEFVKNSKGETEHDKILREEMQKINDNEKLESYKNTLKSRYGLDDLEKIENVIKAKEQMDRKSFERWQKIGNINAVGEVGATVVGAVADTAIDGLSGVTPYGNYIKAGYKGIKGVAGTMADKGVSVGSFAEGAIKGGTDAALDSKYFSNNPIKKAIVTVGGEAAGSALGEALRPGNGDWVNAGTKGALDGVFKVGVGAVTDKIGGDSNISLPKGAPKFLPTMKNVLVNRSSATKIGGTMTDEFLVKPKLVEPIKKYVTGK